MLVNRALLEQLYLEKIEQISEDLPDKETFYISEIINIISDIIENNNIYE